MKNKLTAGLLSVFAFVVALITLSHCNSDSDARPDALPKIEQDQIKVQKAYILAFATKYESFIGSLSSNQQAVLKEFIASEDAKAAAKTNVEATCNCGEGMATCKANGAFTECCICWNPNTQVGSCGVYWGVAVCKTENNPPPAKAGAPKDLVIVYPAKFAQMLDILSENGADTKSIRSELQTLINLAE
jgi:hypothetical protein